MKSTRIAISNTLQMRCANHSRSSAGKSSANPLRFGLVGAGAIAQAYVKAFEPCEGARLVAVADTRRQAADAVAAATGCHSYGCHEEMAAACALDAVIVCTPPVTHFEISVYF